MWRIWDYFSSESVSKEGIFLWSAGTCAAAVCIAAMHARRSVLLVKAVLTAPGGVRMYVKQEKHSSRIDSMFAMTHLSRGGIVTTLAGCLAHDQMILSTLH
jgi:hypothetical protein